ncbi:hypothetical protein FHW67_004189 [Herbaspirillum sp. Sphag1AN]|uniref:hypothetical protein n=1 Tax=unclassified Herbaspirillum TaxID=2624150 RepID=UPI00160E424C|nr:MULTISPECIES: hypothetical protein [unclassified Herbaspirillum]MBB3214865.1 hypothetical protein [Herbaspirillum sp. Sphag1AN]MBB3248059.1 hypothetical protein [Herbaspirillum sp. Sphag64]
MKSQLGESTRTEAGNQQYVMAKVASFIKPQTQSVITPDSGRPGDEVRHAGSSFEKRSSPQDSTWPYFGPSTTARKPLIPRAKLRPATQPESKSDINQKKVVRFDPTLPPEPVSSRYIGKVTLPRVRLSSGQYQTQQSPLSTSENTMKLTTLGPN